MGRRMWSTGATFVVFCPRRTARMLDWLEMRCKQMGMETWLRTAISDASQG